MEPTKLVESFDAAEGYKVYKIAFDQSCANDNDKKESYVKGYEQGAYGEPIYYPNGSSPFLPYPNVYPSQGYPYDYMIQNQRPDFVPEKKLPQK